MIIGLITVSVMVYTYGHWLDGLINGPDDLFLLVNGQAVSYYKITCQVS